MKKLIVVLAVLFAGILLAGCTSQQAAPVATPTSTPVPTAVPTAVPTTAAPTPTPTANATPAPTATPTPTPTPQNVVTITFTPSLTILPGTTVQVPVGTKVVWVNNDPLKPHGIQATTPLTGAFFGGMSPDNIPYGQSYAVTFTKAGSYDYTTVFQPQTTGKIVVV